MRKFAFWSSRRSAWLFGLGLSALVWLLLNVLMGGAISRLEMQSGDWVWRLTTLGATSASERRVILVDIDESSLQELGSWPWSRNQVAQLIEQIGQAGGQLQVYDVVFSEMRSGDDQMARAIAQYHPVFSQVLALETPLAHSVGTLRSPLNWPDCPSPFGSATGYLANVGAWDVKVGHITPRLSVDGVLRTQPAVICHNNRAYPALDIAALMQLSGESTLALQEGKWNESAWQLTGANLIPQNIPLDRQGDVRFPWRLPTSSFVSLSAADVLAHRIPKEILKNAIVLVGSTALGLNDAIATPLNPIAAGMQAHAELLTGLLDNSVPFTPRFALVYQGLLILLGLGVVALLARKRSPSYWIPVVGLAFGVVYWLFFVWALWRYSWWLGWLEPASFVFLATLCWGALEHARSGWDRDLLYQHLSSYLPAPVAHSLALQSPSNAIHATTESVVVMFADIRNFSAYCESRPAEEAAAVLQAFFAKATQIVSEHQGEIEAFQGDAVIAIWRLPSINDDGSMQIQALHSALALQADSLTFLPDPAPAGLAPLALGIGMESGSSMVGSFGLAKRRTHLVMGPTVTVASALVNMTSELSHPILIGQRLASQLHGVHLQSMGEFLLEGLRQAHQVYAYPLSESPD